MHVPSVRRDAWSALLVLLFLEACAGQRAEAPPAAAKAQAADAWEIIGRAASTYSKQHLRHPDRIGLVRTAVLALEGDAGEKAPVPAPDGQVYEALRAALARHRVARPDRSEQERAEVGLAAMVRTIDDDTGYYPEREHRGGAGAASGAGVGIVVAGGASAPVIERVLVDGPAARAGMQAGLEIRTIAGVTTGGLTPTEVIDRLRGPAGSSVSLGVGLPGAATSELSLRRAPVADRTDCRVLEGDLLYLRPGPFERNTKAGIQSFASANAPVRGVVLDLRGNQGGLLDEVAGTADLFLPEGVIYEARGPQIAETVRAKAGTSPLESVAVVVLVDRKTGSGAEAVAAALQDTRRGIVVGEPTAGRAMIAALFQIPGFVLKIPIAELLRAGGVPIGPGGVKPDLVPPSGSPPGLGSDVACRGLASPSPVGADPAVAFAVAQLRGRAPAPAGAR
jgi:C-terminal peptidase prc